MDSKKRKPDSLGGLVRFFNLIFILFFLIGCDRAGPRPEALTPVNSVPTIVALTAAALPSPTLVSPTSTSTATQTSTPVPTLPAISTSTPLPTGSGKIPFPAIRILSPGPMSKVISPIILKSYVYLGYKGQVQIDLLGEDGRLLARDIIKRELILTDGNYVSLEIPFETRAAAELGRLQISTKDEFGRPQDVKTVHLLLLSVGENDLNRGDTYPRAIFFYPKEEEEFYGGILPVSGEFQAYNDRPIIVEIIDEEGKTLGLRTLYFEAGSREKFEITIPYTVEEQVSARLTIRQADEKFDGRVYLHSQIVILNP